MRWTFLAVAIVRRDMERRRQVLIIYLSELDAVEDSREEAGFLASNRGKLLYMDDVNQQYTDWPVYDDYI